MNGPCKRPMNRYKVEFTSPSGRKTVTWRRDSLFYANIQEQIDEAVRKNPLVVSGRVISTHPVKGNDA